MVGDGIKGGVQEEIKSCELNLISDEKKSNPNPFGAIQPLPHLARGYSTE